AVKYTDCDIREMYKDLFLVDHPLPLQKRCSLFVVANPGKVGSHAAQKGHMIGALQQLNFAGNQQPVWRLYQRTVTPDLIRRYLERSHLLRPLKHLGSLVI